ncbi:PVC-type heme-binding CxxCH protein [Prosthecobacter sp.]|uniref:PVC-type heme-binding CxxCH protein n=1 Tax=Prosthecobacter sp. TaxID=1965333 RepID=UPI002489902D|nr:PVC-type heme-binding CxxCH protein [Prosthecobacter sp.]MDI1312766.1 c-type cytochrome [Prosthecobacter sp.]
MSFIRYFLTACILAASLPAAEDKMRLVRETEALTPEQERAGLHVPRGFTVQLFASEPMINKPINMAFDARGRLWVASTVEYPYSADKSRWADEKGTHVKDSRDAIKILEDTDGDGKADKVTDFAGGLNIPTGVLPWHKPEHKSGCIAWSIPNIWYFADTDGDDKADHREILFGPLGYEKDTHGMCSSFRLGLDGWVYATHGFNNTSHFKAKDGSTLDLHSGNVFRFKPDGSRIEQWTSGQVNPFGLCWDRFGNLYSADCHSSPIYQLIRGACYPSFGKPDDGLGFAPVMCQHSHGSTGICGIVYLDGGVWGPEWDDHTLVGNCVTSRVNHDKVTFTGSTPMANEQPDFITSDDPWFRPVDLQLGPDNALYIADFYNKIIGHYEVPLDHPGRDKERGRIWRVVKTGKDTKRTDLTNASLSELYKQLDSPNLTVRHNTVPVLVERLIELPEEQAVQSLQKNCQSAFQKAYAIWATHQVWLRNGRSLSFMGNNTDDFVDVHLLLRESEGPIPEWRLAVLYTLSCLAPDNQRFIPRTQLAATWALTNCLPDARSNAAGVMITMLQHVPAADLTLRQALRIASRKLLSDPAVFMKAVTERSSAPSTNPEEKAEMQTYERDFREVALSLKSAASSEWLLKQLTPLSESPPDLMKCLSQIAKYGNPEILQRAVETARHLTKSNFKQQTDALYEIHNGLSERGDPANPELLKWAQQLATQFLDSAQQQAYPAWTSSGDAQWSLQPRKCTDGTETQVLQSMAKGGGDEEKRSGILKSKDFAAPAKLIVWINGHRGQPTSKAHDKNLVRVVHTQSGTTLASAFPPRSDVCQRTELDLSKHTGKSVRLEIVDGDDGKAYAWLGITRIEPAVVSVNDFQSEDSTRRALKTLAMLLQHTAPAALREKLAPYLPARPAPPPLPVSPEQRKQLDALIATRSAAFAKAEPDLAAGKTVFTTNCAVCHQIRGAGGLIGPQLDGIGARGAERLSEDILDPNRNVDAHFHLHTLTLKDASTLSGFLKGEAGQVLILADAAGQEHRISKNDLAKDETTPMSLMPPIFGQTLDEATFVNLLGYLMNEKAGK